MKMLKVATIVASRASRKGLIQLMAHKKTNVKGCETYIYILQGWVAYNIHAIIGRQLMLNALGYDQFYYTYVEN